MIYLWVRGAQGRLFLRRGQLGLLHHVLDVAEAPLLLRHRGLCHRKMGQFHGELVKDKNCPIFPWRETV